MLHEGSGAEALDALRAKYERRLDRERRARHAAEDLLEGKSRELYAANLRLTNLAEKLEHRVSERTTELAFAERRAVALAERDQLTGIANRMVFARMLEEAIATGTADRRGFALLLIDLDNFKHVNDGFGHDVGDALLRHTADRIAVAIGEADSVARIGGDEFATIAGGWTGLDDLAALGRRVIASVRDPLRHRGHVVEASCSIGAAVFPDHAVDGADLQRFADLALYRAKAAGRNGCVVFNEELRREYDDRHAIGSDLKTAIEGGQIEPWFQPIVDARTTELVGVEALARWRHPERGLIMPMTFLGLAEERGLTGALFAAMLKATCRETLGWIRSGFIRQASVNVSPSQFRTGTLAETVDAILRAESFPATALTVEITEEVLLNDLGSAHRQLKNLARIGVRVALDDFGVGYSNIGYLRRLPLHQLKLDRVLTADVVGDRQARSILAAIVDIARTLDLTVIAEGVETTTQAEWLSHLGCDKLQGFLFGEATDRVRFASSWPRKQAGLSGTAAGEPGGRASTRLRPSDADRAAT